MRMIGITGGTGFVGQRLTSLLQKKGWKIIIFTRDMHKVSRIENVKYSYWSPAEKKFDITYLRQVEAVIHLAGASIEKRWTELQKEKIVESRVRGTRFLIDCLREHGENCKTLVAASAIGYYGGDGNRKTPFRETDGPGNDFLADTCKKWEATSNTAADFLRLTILRFGIVLGKGDGAFAQFAQPQNLGIMPVLGDGHQVVSWIHIDDLCRLISWVLEQEVLRGVYNAVAPNPVSSKRLMDTIANQKGGIKLPLPVPSFLLRLALGEMSEEALKSCTVSAEKILSTGFNFLYPDIRSAVKQILSKNDR